MTALTAGKNIKTRELASVVYGVLANAVIQTGGIVTLTSAGFAQAASTGTNQRCVGYAEQGVSNAGGANGAQSVTVQKGCVLCINSSAGDAITDADVNALCYLVDDQTVAKTSGSNTRSAAGRVVSVEAQGVWVALGEPAMPVA
jgi:hypothetical protein